MKTRVDLAGLVPADGLVVELGVATGAFSVAMLERRPDITVWSIDRWSDHHDEREYVLACARLFKYAGRSMICRASFDEAVNVFQDGSIDLVYVDGYAHTGQEGGGTLRDWWPKVRRGGVLAGHDYHPHWQPTIEAVDAFAVEVGQEINLIHGDQYPSWWIRKPLFGRSEL